MYFPFSELRKWSKKTAETRRRNCAVLPLILIRKASPEGAASFVIYKERNHKQVSYELLALRAIKIFSKDFNWSSV